MKKHDTSIAPLIPLLAIGVIIILLLLVIKQYVTTATIDPTIILPGGQTYVGK